MYVTRRLLRATIEEVKRPSPTHSAEPSPRKRRLAVVKEEEEEGEKEAKSGKKESHRKLSNRRVTPETAEVYGVGLLVDARDKQNRWCEAKILKADVEKEKVFIHYMGWNARYDCWTSTEWVAPHGSETKVKPKSGTSWMGKIPLFGDPSKPPVESKKSGSKSARKRERDDGKIRVKTESKPSKSKKKKTTTTTSSSSSSSAGKVQVRVDTVDEESERQSRRQHKEKVDMELEIEVRGDAPTESGPRSTKGSTPSSRSKAKSPIVAKAKTPTLTSSGPAARPQRKPSPRGPTTQPSPKTKEENVEAPSDSHPLHLSSTLPLSLRRNRRAASSKKAKKEDEESDEDYVDEPEAEEEEEEDEGEEEEEEEDLDELDDERPAKRARSVSTRNGKAKQTGSMPRNPPRHVDPAAQATKDHLAAIFRLRIQQRAQMDGSFQGSFQQAMLAGAVPRVAPPPTRQSQSNGKRKASKKKSKASHTETDSDSEGAAAAAAQYYAQQSAYYQMQAYQYQQYYYHQAMLAAQQQQQVAGQSSQSEDGEAPSTTTPDESMMDNGIIDPRVIQARVDVLEHQRRLQAQHVQEYYYQVMQARERNLQMLASSQEFLDKSQATWESQASSKEDEGQEEGTKSEQAKTEATTDGTSEGNTPQTPPKELKGDETREPERTIKSSPEQSAESGSNECEMAKNEDQGALDGEKKTSESPADTGATTKPTVTENVLYEFVL
ncbi:hypothetical protein Poli38472_012638 [Pythium oligandrum]|uniref:Tudor-knot domain-containing protein n=1 Tax=Pythium oligandrum TaxID=41045 RepID=A0A8K1CDT6_PYTOL|nr:hypothetical protein Poli38472_012638 [Pythium oligandrum]|eukprot:TMW61447.1 hypothetical protein Poli38472_012638 [Pythium oligandrum]